MAADKLRRSKKDVSGDLKPVRAKFGGLPANRVTAAAVARWVDELRDQDYASATCNRWTQLLDQAYSLAIHRRELATRPYIEKLSEAGNARQGTITTAEFERLVLLLPAYLVDFVRWAYVTGWRAGAISSLRWSDLQGDRIVVRAQYSKIRESHSIPLVGPLRAIATVLTTRASTSFTTRTVGPSAATRPLEKSHSCCRSPGQDVPRSTPHGGDQPTSDWSGGEHSHADHRAQDAGDVRSLLDQRRRRLRQAIVQREQWEYLERQKELEEARVAGPVQ